jgi:hypothetical protein
MHYAYGTELKDIKSYMKLKIPAAPNLIKTRLVMSQPTQNFHWHNYTISYFPSFMFPFSHKISLRDRRSHSHLIASLGISMSIQDKVNAISTLSVPAVTLLGAVTSDYLRRQLRGLE